MNHVALFIIDTLQTGGAEKSLLDITSRFRKYRPVFFQLFPGGTLHPEFRRAGIEVVEFNLKPAYNFRAAARHISHAAKALRPTVVHSTLFRSDMVSRHLKPLVAAPLINSFVNNSYGAQRYRALSGLGKLKLLGIQLWDRALVGRVDLFISNSFAIRQTNADALGLPLDRIEVIYRGRDARHFVEGNIDEVMKVKESLAIGDRKVLLNVSRLLDRKGQLDLIRAFRIVVEKRQDIVLLIAGEGSFRGTLEQEISNLGLNESVILLGNRKDVPTLIRAADVFAFPSHYEGLPGALIEAMFGKILTVVSDIPENLECVDSSAGWLFPVGNVDNLAQTLLAAFNDPDKQDRVQAAYNRAVANFDIEQIALRYEQVYDKLCVW